MSDVEQSSNIDSSNGIRGGGMSLSSLEQLTNYLVFLFGLLTVLASISVFIIAQAQGREKDRELDQYKASAHVRIAEANATAEQAKAEAARAKTLAIVARQRLAEVRGKLNDEQAIHLFSETKMASLSHALATLNLEGAVIMAAGSTGAEPLARAKQVADAITASGVPRPLGTGVDGFNPPAGVTGDFVVTYYSQARMNLVNQIRDKLRVIGFTATSLKLAQDAGVIGEVQEPLVFINVLPRNRPGF